MKIKDLSDLKLKTAVELETMADKIRMDIIKAKMDLKMHKQKNTNIAKNLRRNLAQILTVKNNLRKEKKT